MSENSVKLGIDKVKVLLGAVIEFGNVTGEVMEDGKFTVGDITPIITLWDDIKAIVEVDKKEMSAQFLDIDEVERAELGVFIKEKFDIPQDEIEQKIEQGLTIALKLVEIGFELKDFIIGFKK